jgi:hypothetical protein
MHLRIEQITGQLNEIRRIIYCLLFNILFLKHISTSHPESVAGNYGLGMSWKITGGDEMNRGVSPRWRKMPRYSSGTFSHFLQFFAQGFSVDTEDLGGPGLIAVDECQHIAQMLPFDIRQRSIGPRARLTGTA